MDETTITPGRVSLIGPHDEHMVTVDGWTVPFLTAQPVNGGRVDLTLDNRYGLVLDIAEAERIVPFIADAVAIALGYTCHPREDWEGPKRRYEMSRLRPLYFEEGPQCA